MLIGERSRLIAGGWRSTILLLLAVLACNGSTTDPASPAYSGVYVLDQIDGIALPGAVPGLTSATSPCPTLVTDGEFDLNPAGIDYGPLYGWGVFAGQACDPIQAAMHSSAVAGGAGRWSGNGTTIQFNATRDNRNIGSYTGAVTSGPSGYTLTFTLDGHQYRWHRARADQPPGTSLTPVLVSVVDPTGHAISGAFLLFHVSDGEVSRGVSSTGQPFGTGVPSGNSVSIYVGPPAGYIVPSSQPNPVTVTVPSSQAVSVTITLANAGS